MAIGIQKADLIASELQTQAQAQPWQEGGREPQKSQKGVKRRERTCERRRRSARGITGCSRTSAGPYLQAKITVP
jgi:hypothetical protein